MGDATLSKDCWLLQAVGGTTKYGNGDGDYIHVGPIPSGGAGPDWKSRAFVEWDVTAELSGKTLVTSAIITLKVAPNDCIVGGRGSTQRIFAEKCTSTFTERAVGSNCAFESCSTSACWPGPSVDTDNRAFHSSGSHSTGDDLTWDVTDMLEAIRAAGETVCTIRFISADSGGTAYDETTAARRIAFYSQEHATAGNRPKLTITATTGSTDKNTSDTATATESASITNTGSGTVNVSDSAVADDQLVRAGQFPLWETEILFGEDEGAGRVTLYTEDDRTHALLSAVGDQDILMKVKFQLNDIPEGGIFSWRLVCRAIDNQNFYYLSAVVDQQQGVNLVLGKCIAGVETQILMVPDVVTLIVETYFFVKFQCKGISPTAMSGKIWRDGNGEPGWQIVSSDSSSPMQADGTIGLGALVTTINNLPLEVTFDNFEAIAAP